MIKRISLVLVSSFLMFSNLNAAEVSQTALVETQALKKQEVNDLQEFVGTVNFDKKSKIASETSGVVKKISFEVGQKVKKDEVLIQID